ncbi:hypothetical protein BDP67DRAFT_493491 [Colletotrichum lupini]|nr:hypothetical protein BDP67DRAFT_493491 [Colletotrichum lupini]
MGNEADVGPTWRNNLLHLVSGICMYTDVLQWMVTFQALSMSRECHLEAFNLGDSLNDGPKFCRSHYQLLGLTKLSTVEVPGRTWFPCYVSGPFVDVQRTRSVYHCNFAEIFITAHAFRTSNRQPKKAGPWLCILFGVLEGLSVPLVSTHRTSDAWRMGKPGPRMRVCDVSRMVDILVR